MIAIIEYKPDKEERRDVKVGRDSETRWNRCRSQIGVGVWVQEGEVMGRERDA